MISLILYGRNDNHGYNLHKRAAISLNAMSEVLTDPDDEILFVDYNTPDDLPTFPEAIADTLTGRTRERLRVLRARPSVHAPFRSKTHLVALESISRNIALRRSNPNNRWVLSTNTDMIFVPHGAGDSLTEIVRDLPEGFYQLPRFELPEVLWESFDRRDGQGIIDRTREWAHRFHLNEIVYGSPEILYDGPGDFQLCRRSDLIGIHGFHEGMLRGWHVDANLCARMKLLRGDIKGLADHLYGYHCDHTRQATAAHTHDRVENDADDFMSVTDPQLPAQVDNWGLPDERIEEIRLGRADVFSRYVKALEAAIPAPQSDIYESAYRSDTYGGLTYRRAHVLPFVMDLVAPFSREARILYVGARTDMFQDFLRAHRVLAGISKVLIPEEMDWLEAGEGAERRPLTEALEDADLLVFEFGVGEPDETVERKEMVSRLAGVRRALIAAGTGEQSRVGSRGLARRRVIAINAIHNEFESLVINYLAFTLTPFSSRVRHGHFLIENAAAQEQSFDVRAVWRDVQKQTGRTRALPLWETQELTKLATAAVAAAPNQPLASEALACAEPLIAFLRHEKVTQASGICTEAARALADRLAAERPGAAVYANLQKNIGEAERDRALTTLSRAADVSDWEKPSFARFVDHHFGGARAYAFPDRNLWTWERASVLDVLQEAGLLTPKSRMLLVSTVADAFAPALADYVGRLELARVSPPHSNRFLGERRADEPDPHGFEEALPFWSITGSPGDFDAVVFIQHAVMGHGPDQVARALSEAAGLTKIGGLVVVSAQACLHGESGAAEFAAAPMLDGRFASDLAETGSSLEFCGPLEARLTLASCDRREDHRRADLRHRNMVVVEGRDGERIATEAVLTFRRITRDLAEGASARPDWDRSPVAHMSNAALARVIVSDVGDLLWYRFREFSNRLRGTVLKWAFRSRFVRSLIARARFRARVFALRSEQTWRGEPQTWSDQFRTKAEVAEGRGVFEIPPGTEGHALYGPYLPLRAGRWMLRFKAQTLEESGAPEALLVDVIQYQVALAEAKYEPAVLDGREHVISFFALSDLLYDLSRNLDLIRVETRFAARNGVGLRIWDIRLEPDIEEGTT